MEPKELKRLISQGENQQLDFKKTITSSQKIAKTISSFANTNGGKILIGVMDNKEISGVDLEEEMFQVMQGARHYCDPPIPVSFDKAEKDGKMVLVVHVEESNFKPHKCLTGHNDWQTYVRMNDKSVLSNKLNDTVMKGMKAKKPTHKLSGAEKSLVKFLEKKEKITLKQFAHLVNISERRAKRILTDLTLNGVLFLHDYERESFYSLAS